MEEATAPPAPPEPPKLPKLPPAAHELRIMAVLPLPADPMTQARIVAGIETPIETFAAALRQAHPEARMDVQVVRTKPRKEVA